MCTVEQKIQNIENELNCLKQQLKDSKQPEFTHPMYFIYPMYFKEVDSNLVVKFDGLKSGTVVDSDYYPANYYSTNWTAHTDKDIWVRVDFDEERGLFDKQLVMCWDYNVACSRSYRFYDAKNQCTFNQTGVRYGMGYHYYQAVPFEQYPDWAKEAIKHLDD